MNMNTISQSAHNAEPMTSVAASNLSPRKKAALRVAAALAAAGAIMGTASACASGTPETITITVSASASGTATETSPSASASASTASASASPSEVTSSATHAPVQPAQVVETPSAVVTSPSTEAPAPQTSAPAAPATTPAESTTYTEIAEWNAPYFGSYQQSTTQEGYTAAGNSYTVDCVIQPNGDTWPSVSNGNTGGWYVMQLDGGLVTVASNTFDNGTLPNNNGIDPNVQTCDQSMMNAVGDN